MKLRDLADIRMGQSPDSRHYNSEGVGYPFLQGCAQFGRTYPITAIYCSTPMRIASSGSILFSVRAPVGEINIADQDYCIGRGLAAIEATSVDSSLLYYLLLHARPRLNRIAQGSTFEAISSSDLADCILPDLGSSSTQSAIAAILTTVDRAIEQTEALIAKQRRIKAGLLHDLLTRGIDEHGQLRDPSTHRFKQSPVGLVPEEWEVTVLSRVVDANRPIVYGILMPGYGFPNGVPVIKVRDIVNNNVNMTDLLLTDPKIDEAYKRSRLRRGDLLFSIRGTVGRMAFVPDALDGANITQDTARISITKASPVFVRHYLDMPTARAFIELHWF